jgi:hypothetical protein
MRLLADVRGQRRRQQGSAQTRAICQPPFENELRRNGRNEDPPIFALATSANDASASTCRCHEQGKPDKAALGSSESSTHLNGAIIRQAAALGLCPRTAPSTELEILMEPHVIPRTTEDPFQTMLI